MDRVIIIHCWEGYPEYCWYPYVKKELENKNFQVEIPAMPHTKNPIMNEWLQTLKTTVGKADENLYLIGHSLGCATIMRYLESLPDKTKIGGIVFVAGFNENVGYDEIQTFFETPINLENIKSKSKNGFIAIHSDNDPYVDLKYADTFKNKLDAKIIIKHNGKHFSGAIEDEEAYLKLPEVVESIDKLSKNK